MINWMAQKIAMLKQKKEAYYSQKMAETAKQMKIRLTHGKSLTPKMKAWVNELEKFDKVTAVSIKTLEISNQIKATSVSPSPAQMQWLKENDHESLVPVGFRDLDVDTEWRWVWDPYTLNQFRVALKFAPQQKLGQVINGLHKLVNIPVSDYHQREREPFRHTLSRQIFELITGQKYSMKSGLGVSAKIEEDRQKRFLRFIYRSLRGYEWSSKEQRSEFDHKLLTDMSPRNLPIQFSHTR